ncbi:hydantoinase/oxoprolinase family protein [Pararhodobacter sp. SW119]|uniref:hydantoinase/oxoprolinase family protein n=1 Tax=Pararhodobacter sp. SW119 TaxID=2780075 RepID=UPI001FD7ED88|nr:hydantoinase/oxoprolinase family protein [Pararhodobacter sp. SW119]
MRVGVEVGGTFTDLIRIQNGSIRVAKVPSTPAEPDRGVIHALDAAGIDLSALDDFVHGSTVATNAILERKGGRTAAIVTKGLRDIFLLQRHDRTSIYKLNYRKPEPIVERQHVFEIDERITSDGNVVKGIDEETTKAELSRFLAQEEFDAVAICLLNSYRNSDHERLVERLIAGIDADLSVTCSVDVAPEFREYERASTTALAAYVQPAIRGYLRRLERSLSSRGFSGRFSMMQSNGGRLPAAAMGKNAISALYSGPAAGVIGATTMAKSRGISDIITLDMGGTSTDVSLVVAGKPDLTPETKISGLPVRAPVIDIETVGSGGGSIVWVDDGGLMRVGPSSAGADPGPACYGRGGKLPTVTDAHLVRGTLRQEMFRAGALELDPQAAHESFKDIATRLGTTVREVADHSIRLAESSIVRAIERVSTQRGRDPRNFTLVPFGGAGALHAARVAEELGIQKIYVPMNSGVLSAVGLLVADYVHYCAKSERVILNQEALPKIANILDELRDSAKKYLHSQGVKGSPLFRATLDMRYVGQAFEVPVLLDGNRDDVSSAMIAEKFSEAHQKIFEFSKPPDEPIEIVTFRMGAQVESSDAFLNMVRPADGDRDSDGTPFYADIFENGRLVKCAFYTGRGLGSVAIAGPCVISDETSTIFVPEGWTAVTDGLGNVLLDNISGERE